MHGIDHGDDIFDRRSRLDVVNRIKYESAAVSEELFDRQPEVYRHSVLPPEAYYDLMVVSTGTRRVWPIRNLGPLTDDYSLTSDWDNQWLTGVLEGLPGRVGMNPVVDLFVVRKVEIAEGLNGTEGGGLRAEICAADVNRLNAVAYCGVDLLKILEGNLALALKDLVNVVLAAAGGDVPLRNVANSLGMLHEWSWNQRDIAESSSAETGNHAATRGEGLLR